MFAGEGGEGIVGNGKDEFKYNRFYDEKATGINNTTTL